jgi:hypothetical protein
MAAESQSSDLGPAGDPPTNLSESGMRVSGMRWRNLGPHQRLGEGVYTLRIPVPTVLQSHTYTLVSSSTARFGVQTLDLPVPNASPSPSHLLRPHLSLHKCCHTNA